MKQIIKVIRKVDIEAQYLHVLELEKDYELDSLFYAMKAGDAEQIRKSKERLKEIVGEMEMMSV